MAAFDDRPVVYEASEVERAGAFVSIDRDGALRVERGYVRPEDELPLPADPEPETGAGPDGDGEDDGDATAADGSAGADDRIETAEPEEEGDIKPLPDRLMTELTAHRTLALRHALGGRPDVAFLAALHALCLNRKHLTAALIDSRDFLMARRRAETEVMLPAGPKIGFTGGYDCNDTNAIWAALDRVNAKHPGMVLLHGGSPKGAERIAACWADSRKVPQLAFRPDFNRHKNAAPFKRNDVLLETMPIGVVVFPGSGISDNLADKARKLGIPLFDFRPKGGGACPARC